MEFNLEQICEENKTIPSEKLGLDNTQHRTLVTKPNVDIYLEPTIFDEKRSYNFIKEISDFIFENSQEYNIDLDYNINTASCDIFIDELKLGFKFITFFKYCEINTDKKNQLKTYQEFTNAGYKFIQIFEDTWFMKKEIIKSRILNLLNRSEKIFARKCVVKEIKDTKVIGDFIENNHSQGKIGSSVKLGLYYNDELVSAMTFGSFRKNMGQESMDGGYELLRFCNKLNTNVIGGASKLFKYFKNNYNPKLIISYADKCWSSSNECLYKTLGLKYIHESDPSYFYIVGDTRKGRFGYRKDELLKCGYDGTHWGEHTIMLTNKIYRIYDVGTCKYEWSED